MTHTRIPVAAVLAALCLVGPLAGCTSSGSSGRSSAPSAASAGPSSGSSVGSSLGGAARPRGTASAGGASPAAVTPLATAVGDSNSDGPTSTSPPATTAAPSSSVAPSYDGPPITLTIGTDDSPGVPSADEITHFADAVKKLSGGNITITPKWHADGDGHLDWDQQVAKLVQKGTLDLALGPTWAWDVLGVDSFEPLQSPFLVDSDALVAQVITDSQLPGELMAGMPKAGVIGISLWPEGLRHPFGFDKPLLTPADFKGTTVRSPKSDTTTKIFAALGAKTSSDEPVATTMVGSQSEYPLAPNGIGAANVTFFPKVNVLYANTDSYAKLNEAAKATLAEAAADTQTWAIDRTSDVTAGEDFCDGNHTLVTATNGQLTDLVSATQPVADAIKAAHPDQIAAITTLKASTPFALYADACTPTVPTPTTHAAGPAEAALNGTYRFTLTPEDLTEAGYGDDVHHNAGVFTFTLSNGKFRFVLDPSQRSSQSDDEVDGTYQVAANELTLTFPTWGNEIEGFTFQLLSNGNLTLTSLIYSNIEPLPAPEILFTWGSKVWERIK